MSRELNFLSRSKSKVDLSHMIANRTCHFPGSVGGRRDLTVLLTFRRVHCPKDLPAVPTEMRDCYYANITSGKDKQKLLKDLELDNDLLRVVTVVVTTVTSFTVVPNSPRSDSAF